MRFGAHVSSSGASSKAIGRGRDLGCESLQVFTHNPRTWRPINHSDEEIAAFRAGAEEAGHDPLVSHGLYLINLGAPDKEVPSGPPGKPATATRNIYRSSVESLVQHLEVGEQLGPRRAWCCTSARSRARPRARRSRASARASRRRSRRRRAACCVFLENTAGAGDTIGRTFAQLRAVADAVGAPERLGFCLDTPAPLRVRLPHPRARRRRRVLDDFDREIGIDRLRCLHLNDSKVGFASNRDRHENIGDGEIGEDGIPELPRRPDAPGPPRDPGGPRASTAAARTWRTWRASGGSTRRRSPPGRASIGLTRA